MNTRLEVTSAVPTEDMSYSELGIMDVFKQIYPRAVSVFMVFFITFIIFPAVFLRGSGLPSLTKEPAWFITLMLFTFNVFDTVGRTLGGKYFAVSAQMIPLPVSLRSIFIFTTIMIAFV